MMAKIFKDDMIQTSSIGTNKSDEIKGYRCTSHDESTLSNTFVKVGSIPDQHNISVTEFYNLTMGLKGETDYIEIDVKSLRKNVTTSHQSELQKLLDLI